MRELENLAYIGEHHFPDLTYKSRLAELAADYKASYEKLLMCSMLSHQWDTGAHPYCLSCGVGKARAESVMHNRVAEEEDEG